MNNILNYNNKSQHNIQSWNIQSWIMLAISSIAISGMYSILLIFARTPFLQKILPWKDLFYTSLVVHVDLSILVWLLSVTSILWVSVCKESFYFINKVIFNICCIGTMLIAISPFIGNSNPIMNNYVPILHNIIFLLGLSIFMSGMLVQSIITIIHHQNQNIHITSSAIIFVIAFLCFVFSANSIEIITEEYSLDLLSFYERIFWAGGHILQFCYVQLLIIIWSRSISHAKYLVNILSIMNVVILLPTILIFYYYRIDSAEFIQFFTNQMIYFGGLSPTILAIIMLIYILKNRLYMKYNYDMSPSITSIICSFILFFSGGIIGLIIQGSNVIIPAHYHGSIVGISVAAMGFIYLSLENLNYRYLLKRMSHIQLFLYAFGQMLHVIGFAWSGGYGALRKTPTGDFTQNAKLGLALMGVGGLFAVLGGILFVFICYIIIRKGKESYESRSNSY